MIMSLTAINKTENKLVCLEKPAMSLFSIFHGA